jgi:pantetheine-phosphate adenylyltransferase
VARYRRAVLGGTFDRLHVGHEALIDTAFRLGRTVAIGVTTEAFLRAHPKPRGGAIAPFSVRLGTLRRWLRRHHRGRTYALRPLDDSFGGSVAPDVDLLVVSAETSGGGRRVNAERRRRGLPPVPVEVVPLVLADDLGPVSSRRIRAGTIDPRGRRLARISVGLATERREDLPAAASGLRGALPKLRLNASAPPRRERGSARARALTLARRAARGAELGVGIARTGSRIVVAEATARLAIPSPSVLAPTPAAVRRAVFGTVRRAPPQRL